MLKKLRVVFIILALVLWGALAYFGVFSSVEVKKEQKGAYYLAYKTHIGDYQNAGNLMSEIYDDLKNKRNIFGAKGFGMYYDNPQTTDANSLRSVVGCIVPFANVEQLKGEYKVIEFPASESFVTSFPYRGKFSFAMAVVKVYPKLNEHLSNEHLSNEHLKGVKELQNKEEFAIMEIYDQENGVIEFIASPNVADSIFKKMLE